MDFPRNKTRNRVDFVIFYIDNLTVDVFIYHPTIFVYLLDSWCYISIKVAISHLFSPAVRSVIIPSDAFLTNKQGFPAGARACCGCDGVGTVGFLHDWLVVTGTMEWIMTFHSVGECHNIIIIGVGIPTDSYY